jgi:transporter family-2 protein
MKSYILSIFLALLAGAAIPTQGTVNNRMAEAVSSPIASALISFTVGTVCLFVFCILSGVKISSISNSLNAPPIAWLGGLLGAFFVTATIFLIPRLGVALTFSLVVAGQMLITIIIDHYGFLGLEQKPINLQKALGILLIIIGVFLVRRF